VQTLLLTVRHGDRSVSAPFSVATGLLLQLRHLAQVARREYLVLNNVGTRRGAAADVAAAAAAAAAAGDTAAAKATGRGGGGGGGGGDGSPVSMRFTRSAASRLEAGNVVVPTAFSVPGVDHVDALLKSVNDHGSGGGGAAGGGASAAAAEAPHKSRAEAEHEALGNRLRDLVLGYGGTVWEELLQSAATGGANGADSQTAARVINSATGAQTFTQAEDRLLGRGVAKFGRGAEAWAQIAAEFLPTKTAELCVMRLQALDEAAAARAAEMLFCCAEHHVGAAACS